MLYERVVVYETWEMLDRIHTRTPMHWSWAGNSRAGSAAVQAQISWRRAQHSTNDVHPEFGHMVCVLILADVYCCSSSFFEPLIAAAGGPGRRW